MTIPRDAISMANFERWERGLPPRKEVQPKKVDPVPPVVENQLRDIPNLPINDVGVRRANMRNPEGTMFIGYDVYLEFEGGKVLEGWLPEGAFLSLKRRIMVSQSERTDLIKKMSL